jgi:hypothetical protein
VRHAKEITVLYLELDDLLPTLGVPHANLYRTLGVAIREFGEGVVTSFDHAVAEEEFAIAAEHPAINVAGSTLGGAQETATLGIPDAHHFRDRQDNLGVGAPKSLSYTFIVLPKSFATRQFGHPKYVPFDHRSSTN